jgi:hypothetical protein
MVSISWPAQLNNKCALKLVARGRVVRFEDGCVALEIQKYEFRIHLGPVQTGKAGGQDSRNGQTLQVSLVEPVAYQFQLPFEVSGVLRHNLENIAANVNSWTCDRISPRQERLEGVLKNARLELGFGDRNRIPTVSVGVQRDLGYSRRRIETAGNRQPPINLTA